METVRIELFGGLKVEHRGRVLTRFATQKAASLLAYLAYFRDRSHPREVLIELLWPNGDPRAGRNSLSVALSSLRRQLEPPGVPVGSVLQADYHFVRLNPRAIATDVGDFLALLQQAKRAANDADRAQCLSQAVSLYRGELLPGYYQEWIIPEMLCLEELYAQARERLDVLRLAGHSGTPSVEPPNGKIGRRPALSLPLPFNRFFGREEELQRLADLLAAFRQSGAPHEVSRGQGLGSRLISLTGLAGTGKTRLAVEAAAQAADMYEGAVWFVALADISDSQQIPGRILSELPVDRSPQQDPLEQVLDFLRKKTCLLILDNMEHLLLADAAGADTQADGAEIVRLLVEQVPELTCVVTSRRRLGLRDEREIPLLPLATPDVRSQTPNELALNESVQLFLDRAQAVRPSFQLTARNAVSLAEICRCLEGIPLAIELAAARVQATSPAQMLEQLQRRFEYLVTRRRDAPERHRTLWAAVEWSFRLLPAEVQQFFARLSVFRGGWTAEAARHVCKEPNALGLLETLQDCSLVLTEECGRELRFRMLETLREFGWAQLTVKDRNAVQQRHVEFYLALAEAAEPRLKGPEQPDAMRELNANCDNILAALEWCKTESGQAEAGLRIATALYLFWQSSSRVTEGREHITSLLMLAGQSAPRSIRAQALNSIANLAQFQNDLATAHSCYEESLALFRELGDMQKVAAVLNNIGALFWAQGDFAASQSLIEESLAIARTIEDRRRIVHCLTNLGSVARHQGRYDLAYEHLAESLPIARQLGDPTVIANALHNLGNVVLAQNDYLRAQSLYRETIVLRRDLGDKLNVAISFETFAEPILARGYPDRAVTLYGAASVLREAVGCPARPHDLDLDNHILTVARDALGEEAFAACWEKGRAMTMEQAVEYALTCEFAWP